MPLARSVGGALDGAERLLVFVARHQDVRAANGGVARPDRRRAAAGARRSGRSALCGADRPGPLHRGQLHQRDADPARRRAPARRAAGDRHRRRVRHRPDPGAAAGHRPARHGAARHDRPRGARGAARRRLDPGAARRRLSTNTSAGGVAAAKAAGAVDYWTKPIVVDTFCRKMSELLEASPVQATRSVTSAAHRAGDSQAQSRASRDPCLKVRRRASESTGSPFIVLACLLQHITVL